MTSKAYTPQVSVVIKTYDNSHLIRRRDRAIPTLREMLGDTLKALAAQTLYPCEVIVVDSSTGKGILDVIRHFEPLLNLVIHHVPLTPEEFGYPQALNLGIRYATGDVVVSLSGDATPANPRWLEYLVAPLAREDVAGAFSRHVARPGIPMSWAERLRLWWRYRSRETTFRSKDGLFSNACSAFHRELARRIPFDETLHELEDYAWARRVQKRGYVIAYVGESEVLHAHTTPSARTLWRMVCYIFLRLKIDARLRDFD